MDGKWKKSKTDKDMNCFNPSTGEIIAKAPCCTQEEVNKLNLDGIRLEEYSKF